MESDEYPLEVWNLKDDSEAEFERCGFSVSPGPSVLCNTVLIEQNDSLPV